MSFITYSCSRVHIGMKQSTKSKTSATSSATGTSYFKGEDINDTISKSRLASTASALIAASKSIINSIDNHNKIIKSSTSINSPANTFSDIESTQTTISSNAIPWVVNDATIEYNGFYYLFNGFSLTSTEYAASVFGTTSYYDFGYYTYTNGVYYTHYQNGDSTTFSGNNGNSGLTLNTYYFMQNILLNLNASGNGTSDSPFIAPQVRIPVNADYWLKGTANTPSVNSYSSPYFTSGQTNVYFTGSDYQQFIIDFIYYCYSVWTNKNPNTPITFTIDLHWNYSSDVPLTSGSYPSTSIGSPNYSYSNASSKQLPMPGVANYDMVGGGANLSLTDNTLAFWTSVATLFGIDSNGNAISSPSAYTYTGGSPTSYFTKSSSTTNLPINLLQNIMFELYNEPFTDNLTSSTTPYADNYSVYVNGGAATWNGATYQFTGFGQMYNTIRQTIDAQNICIIAGAENYAFMNFNTTSGNGQWNTTTNSINTDTYNCFTTLRDAVNYGDIYLDSNNPSAGYYPAINFYNIMINIHPYVGLYSGGNKHGGFYDSTYSVPIAGLAQIFQALEGTGTFCMNCPIICTEFGGYDLPWSSYSTNPSANPSDYTYSSNYFNYANTPKLISSQGSTYGTPYYNGNYVDADGSYTVCPGIIGYLFDFKKFNVSFCAWAVRPNSGGNGEVIYQNGNYTANSWLVADNNPYYISWNQDTNAWAAFQPDVICGSANAYLNFQNGESAYIVPSTSINSMPNSTLNLALISSTNQNLNDQNINYGANGPDFQYIFDNFYN